MHDYLYFNEQHLAVRETVRAFAGLLRNLASQLEAASEWVASAGGVDVAVIAAGAMLAIIGVIT